MEAGGVGGIAAERLHDLWPGKIGLHLAPAHFGDDFGTNLVQRFVFHAIELAALLRRHGRELDVGRADGVEEVLFLLEYPLAEETFLRMRYDFRSVMIASKAPRAERR